MNLRQPMGVGANSAGATWKMREGMTEFETSFQRKEVFYE